MRRAGWVAFTHLRAKFDTYHFADYKEKVINLIASVTTVSVETQKIAKAMRDAPR